MKNYKLLVKTKNKKYSIIIGRNLINNFQKKHTIELTLFLMFLLQNLTNDLIYSPDVSIYFWIIPMYLFKNIIKSR